MDKVCGHGHRGLRRTSPLCYEPFKGCAEMGWTCYAGAATGACDGVPYGATGRGEGCAEMGWTRYAGATTSSLGGAPYGVTNRVKACRNGSGGRMRTTALRHSVDLPTARRGVPTWAEQTHATCGTEALGEAFYMGPRNVRGVCRNWSGGRMRIAPLRHSVELPMGPRSV